MRVWSELLYGKGLILWVQEHVCANSTLIEEQELLTGSMDRETLIREKEP
jgi:hypothetical protein